MLQNILVIASLYFFCHCEPLFFLSLRAFIFFVIASVAKQSRIQDGLLPPTLKLRRTGRRYATRSDGECFGIPHW
jgi:hypothetical protein